MSIINGIVRNFEKIAARELNNCARNTLPLSDDADDRHYRAHIQEKNARSSEALAITEKLNPIMQLRAHIFRGNFTDAKSLVQQILSDSALEENILVATEVVLEQARIKAFEGAFFECIELSSLALSMNPTAVSKSTLYQTRAVAHYELGQFQEALKDLDIVDSLDSLLPYASTSFYSKILRIKLTAVCQSPAQARHNLDLLWTQKATQLNDPDILLTLIRAEIDVRRRSNETVYEWAIVSYKLAHFMGDKLYTALAKFDVLCAAGEKDIAASIKGEAFEFKRIALFIEELLGRTDSVCTSTQGWLNYNYANSKTQTHLQSPESYNSIVILSKNISISFKPLQVIDLLKRPIFIKALSALSAGPISKAQFFQQVWEMNQYHAHLHDNLVRTTLSNLRKHLKIEVGSQKGMISTPLTLLVRT